MYNIIIIIIIAIFNGIILVIFTICKMCAIYPLIRFKHNKKNQIEKSIKKNASINSLSFQLKSYFLTIIRSNWSNIQNLHHPKVCIAAYENCSCHFHFHFDWMLLLLLFLANPQYRRSMTHKCATDVLLICAICYATFSQIFDHQINCTG